MTKLEKLERLHNRPTRYELIAERGETRILIGYRMRTGRLAILKACQEHGPALIAFMGITDAHLLVFLKPAKLGAHIGSASDPWSIRFTGRTQRDAISTDSELPFIGDWSREAVAA
jgi:hypothetical protein